MLKQEAENDVPVSDLHFNLVVYPIKPSPESLNTEGRQQYFSGWFQM